MQKQQQQSGNRRTSIRRSQVDFTPQPTISEEPTRSSVLTSDHSITLEDLADVDDPRAAQQHRASLEISGDNIPHSLEIEPGSHNNRLISEISSTEYNSKGSSSIMSTIRRFAAGSRRFSSWQSDFQRQESEVDEYQRNTVPHSNINHPQNNSPAIPTIGVPSSRDQRRATIFNRQQGGTRSSRRSIGTRSSSGHGTRSRRRSSMTSSGGSATREHQSQSPREDYCLSLYKIHALRHVINHNIWKGLTLSLILVLLFLPPINDIWFTKSADTAVDGVLTFAFILLAIDIILRCIVDKQYFAWDRKGHFWTGFQDTYCNTRCECSWFNVHCGSFMFWFDTVALLTTLWTMEYINPRMREPHIVSVTLTEIGFPLNGDHATPMQFNWTLVLAIGRMGLMARFIRTSILVAWTQNIHCLRFVSPMYWWERINSRYKEKKEDKQKGRPLISQRVLASSTMARERNSDPFTVSALGDSRGDLNRSSRRDSRLEAFAEEESKDLDPQEDDKPTTMKAFFKGLTTKKSSDMGSDVDNEEPTTSSLFGNTDDSGSHVGAAMRELTGQRIATGALLAVILMVICYWGEADTTAVMTTLTLYGQTANPKYADLSVNLARSSVIPHLFNYTRANETDIIFNRTYELSSGEVEELRLREIKIVDVYQQGSDVYTRSSFDNRITTTDNARVEIVTMVLILIIWIMGVASFAGPVMTLVVEPIERMVRLLSMLMKDPLGYQSSQEFRKLKKEDDECAQQSMWPKEALKGMETNFLMNTILRIGALMRVGFGTAGVEIIRNNLERGRHKDVLFLNQQGSTVSCIFLFCDIRQFTDATECLQEEVFVFTNKIAAVVHSICHSYGGSANKNIGDAFLLSWLLDEPPEEKEEDNDPFSSYTKNNFNLGASGLYARENQADKALLSVVKISMALHYDKFFTEDMNNEAKNRLLTKLSKRKGPVVQMGFGLHAGKAVQGAIGSQRKLDATYISESVERSEFLESATKTYGVPLLMTDSVYNLLDPSNRYRCRKIDQLIMLSEEESGLTDPHEILDSGEKVNLYTFDMDIEALWRSPVGDDDNNSTTNSNSDRADMRSAGMVKRASIRRRASLTDVPSSLTRSSRRSSLIPVEKKSAKEERRSGGTDIEKAMQAAVAFDDAAGRPPKNLILPTSVHHYTDRDWLEPDIKRIRRDYQEGLIFPKYQEGLKSYYAKDWTHSRACFEFILTQKDDGPSRYFLKKMKEHDYTPPRNFLPYTVIRG